MRNASSISLFVLFVVTASWVRAIAADNDKELDNLLRMHADATLKAEQTKLRAVEKSRDDTIVLMIKVASRAYAAKDRVSETNAWKAILRLDREHKKARQYFADLGSLDQVLRQLPESNASSTITLPRFAGKWDVVFHRGDKDKFTITNDGIVTFQNRPKVKCQIDNTTSGAAIILKIPEGDCFNRYTLAGDKLFFEQWCPSSLYPKSAPTAYGHAVRFE